MNKIIFKHLIFAFSLGVFIIFVWLLLLYGFLYFCMESDTFLFTEHFNKTVISDNVNFTIFVFLVILLLGVSVFVFYIYIKKFIFSPFSQIQNMINKIFSNEKISIKNFEGYVVWKDVFMGLKKMNNKVFDIDTTMKMLFAATNINGSDLELVKSVQSSFDIIKKRILSCKCVLLVPDGSGMLRVSAKTGFLKNMVFMPKENKNYVWECYEKFSDKIINDISEIDKAILGGFCDEKDNGSFAAIPLLNESENICVGVLVIIADIKDSFDYDTVELIKLVSRYLAALINRTKYYQEIKERNTRLELEGQFASKELFNKNVLITKRIKNMNTVLDILVYAFEKETVEKSVSYILDKVKEMFGAQSAGILIYNNDKHELHSFSNSFGLQQDLTIINEKDTIYDEIINTGKPIVLNDAVQVGKYLKTPLQDYIKIDSAVFMPVKLKNDIMAVFVLINKNDEDFGSSDLKMLEYISVIIAGMIKK